MDVSCFIAPCLFWFRSWIFPLFKCLPVSATSGREKALAVDRCDIPVSCAQNRFSGSEKPLALLSFQRRVIFAGRGRISLSGSQRGGFGLWAVERCGFAQRHAPIGSLCFSFA